VGIEACASSHHWSRELKALGHTVRLMPSAYVKPYVKRQKNDATDAEFYGVDLAPKQLSLLRELVPKAAVIGLLIDQNVPDAVAQIPAVQEAARNLGLQLVVLKARIADDIDMAFEILAANGPVHCSSVLAHY
jgi:hypothetical protein